MGGRQVGRQAGRAPLPPTCSSGALARLPPDAFPPLSPHPKRARPSLPAARRPSAGALRPRWQSTAPAGLQGARGRRRSRGQRRQKEWHNTVAARGKRRRASRCQWQQRRRTACDDGRKHKVAQSCLTPCRHSRRRTLPPRTGRWCMRGAGCRRGRRTGGCPQTPPPGGEAGGGRAGRSARERRCWGAALRAVGASLCSGPLPSNPCRADTRLHLEKRGNTQWRLGAAHLFCRRQVLAGRAALHGEAAPRRVLLPRQHARRLGKRGDAHAVPCSHDLQRQRGGPRLRLRLGFWDGR